MPLYPEDQMPPAPEAGQAPVAPASTPAAPPPAAEEPEPAYGVKHAIVDALSHKLGFGTPIANVQRMAIAETASKQATESHRIQMEDAKRKDLLAEASKTMAPLLLAVGKPDSRYYKDLPHLAEGINRSEKTKAFFGGELDVADTGKATEQGDHIFSVGLRTPDGQVVPQFEDTTEGALNRFDASLHPTVGAAIRGEVMKTKAEQDLKIETARKYESASMGVKKALGIATTEYDKYLEIKQKFPDLSDWQAREAAGLKVEDRYKPIGTGPVPMSDDRLGITVMDRNDGDKIKVIPLAGTTWSGFKKGTKKETEHWKNLYWPDTDEDPAHEKKAKGIFGALLDATEDPTEQRRLMTEVLPKFREWAELHPGEVDDGKGNMRRLTVGDMQRKLGELMKAAGTAPTGKEEDTGDDAGDWGYYRRRAQNRLSKLMAEEEGAKTKPLKTTEGGKAMAAAAGKAAPAMGLYPDQAAGGRGRMTQPGSIAESVVEKINEWGRPKQAFAQP